MDEKAVLNPSKSLLALKRSTLGICRLLKGRSLKKIGKTPSSHIIHSLGGGYSWMVWDSEPIILLKSLRSLSAYILNNNVWNLIDAMQQLENFKTNLTYETAKICSFNVMLIFPNWCATLIFCCRNFQQQVQSGFYRFRRFLIIAIIVISILLKAIFLKMSVMVSTRTVSKHLKPIFDCLRSNSLQSLI